MIFSIILTTFFFIVGLLQILSDHRGTQSSNIITTKLHRNNLGLSFTLLQPFSVSISEDFDTILFFAMSFLTWNVLTHVIGWSTRLGDLSNGRGVDIERTFSAFFFLAFGPFFVCFALFNKFYILIPMAAFLFAVFATGVVLNVNFHRFFAVTKHIMEELGDRAESVKSLRRTRNILNLLGFFSLVRALFFTVDIALLNPAITVSEFYASQTMTTRALSLLWRTLWLSFCTYAVWVPIQIRATETSSPDIELNPLPPSQTQKEIDSPRTAPTISASRK